ncbi:hypothetical protein H0H93_014716 [Arthromyces matolae]|nr:hypothetical protein H0H93_014716 [Arthromyces matolae]
MTRTGSSADPVPDPHELIGVDADTSPAAAIASLVRSRQAGGDVSDNVPRPPTRSPSTTSKDTQMLPVTTPSPDVRAFVVGLDFAGHSSSHRTELSDLNSSTMRTAAKGFMVSGSEDRKLRLWDLGKLERTAILSGMENETERPSYQAFSTGSASTFVETWPPASTTASQSNRPPQRMSLITQSQQNLLRSHQDIITALASLESPFRGGIITGDRTGVVKVWRVELGD